MLGVARPARRAARSSPPASPGWWPGHCRWPPGSTSRSARSATPSGPTSAWRRASFARDPEGELRELAGIYEQRGLPPTLAGEVAETLSPRGALAAHARDELGLTKSAWRARFRPRGRPRCRSRRARRCRWLAVSAAPARVGAACGSDVRRARPPGRPRGAPRRCAAARRGARGHLGLIAMAITAASARSSAPSRDGALIKHTQSRMYAEQPPASTQWRGRAGGAACSISSSIRSPSCCGGGRGALAGHRRARALRRDCRGHRAQRRVRVRAGAPGRARHGGVARPAGAARPRAARGRAAGDRRDGAGPGGSAAAGRGRPPVRV